MAANLERIRELREAKGLSQLQVAKHLGYRSGVAYCRLETGKRRLRVEHLGALANVLGVSVSDLLTEDPRRPKESTNG